MEPRVDGTCFGTFWPGSWEGSSPAQPPPVWGRHQPGVRAESPICPGGNLQRPWEGLRATQPREPPSPVDSKSSRSECAPPTATDWGPPCPRELALKRRGKVGEGGETCRGRWGTGILLGLGTRKTARKCWESYRCAERNLSKRSVKIKHRKNSSQLAMLGIPILFPLWKITLVNPCHINGQKPKMQGRYYKSGSAVNPWQ